MSDAVRVLVVPRDENPYQRLLYREMDPREAVVCYEDGPTGSQSLNLLLAPLMLARYRAKGFRVLHLHWVFRFALPWARGAATARRAMQWWFARYLDAARLLGFRIVWTAHDLVPHERVFFDDERARAALLSRADMVIALSESTAAQLVGLGARAVRVIPFGPFSAISAAPAARAAARSALGVRDGDVFVVSAGKLEPYKGAELLLEAAARFATDPPVRVLVAGRCRDEAYRRRLEEAAQAAGERATLRIGWVPDDELAAIYAAADFAAFPFTEITNSSSVLMALAHAVPVIIPDLENLHDIPEACALRYDADEGGLMGALQQAVGLPEQRRSAMALAAADFAHLADWSTIARATIGVYAELFADA